MKKKITKTCKGSFYYLLLMMGILYGNYTNAQSASSYVFSSSSGTYTYLSGGTTISAIQTDDAVSSAIPIGFSFDYCGSTYTQLKASSNGWLTFNTSVTASVTSNSSSNLSTIKPALMPLWDDIDGSTTYGGAASYLTSGSAPNRVFTIEYKNWQWNYSKTEKVISFQVKLYETTGVIQYIYKQESGTVASGSASIGICDGASSPTYLSLNNTSSSPTASSSTFTTSLSTKPADGQIYQFGPTPCTGTPTAGSATASATTICSGNAVLLSLPTASTGASIRYQWQSSADNITYTDISGATSLSYTTVPKASTYYRCIVKCLSTATTSTSSSVYVSFTYNISSTTPATRCGTGTVSFSASGTTGATISWFTDSLGGAPIGTGSPFTSPVVTGTTDFYVSAQTSASGTGVVGSGTTSTNSNTAETPFSLYYTSAHTQYLVKASELFAAGFGAGNLTALSFEVLSKASSKAYGGYTIKLAHSTATSLSGGLLSPTFTTVYGPADYNSVSGANTFSFSSAFTWDGISNVIVDVCFDNVTPGTGYSSNDGVKFVPASYVATYGLYSDPTALCGATSGGSTTSTSSIPVITFTGNKVCSSPRVKVTATVNTPPAFALSGTQTVCNNAAGNLAVTSTLSSYNTYKWTPATGLYTDAACTTPYTAGSSASTVYAKTSTAGTNTYICTANNTTSLCSATDTVYVTNLPNAVTAIASPDYLCSSGSAKVSISPSTGYGDAQFQWQTSANNSTFGDSTGATSSTLTTSTITATRYYRLVLKNSSGSFCLNSSSDTAIVRSPLVLSTTGDSRCGPGTLNLKASGQDGIIKWYPSATGGSVLDTGTNFTTSGLASTTTFYVEVEATGNDTVTIGTGTSTVGTSTGGTGQTPFSQYYESARSQYLITAADLSASGLTAGSLVAMTFDVKTKYSDEAYEGYTVKMANTSATSLSSGFISPSFTTVYGPSDYTTATGLNMIPFSTAFNWDGTSNIVVQVCFSNAAGVSYTNNDQVYCTSKSYTATYGTYDDGEFLCTDPSLYYTTSTTNLPNMNFIKKGCVSSRSAVTATINPVPVATIDPATGPVEICDGNTTTLVGGGGATYQWLNTTGILSGATDDSLTTGADDTFRVVVTNTYGCIDTSDAVEVNVNPTPVVSIAPAGSYPICADSVHLIVGTASAAGLTYQWFESGTPISGATDDSIYISTAGLYTLQVYLGTCSDTSNEVAITVNPLPASSFTKTGSTEAICLGSTLELTALTVPSGSSYQWLLNGVEISGATSQIFNASMGGVYSVRITDSNHCRQVSDTLTIINTPMGNPKLSPTDSRFCEGTDIVLYANAGPYAISYAWKQNGSSLPDTTDKIVASTSGLYEVTALDEFGCYATSAKVTVTVDPLPAKPIINKLGAVLTTTTTYKTYQWYRNGKMIPGAIYRSYTMMFDGDYFVEVTNSVGCMNVSDTLSIQGLSVKELPREEVPVKVYPNPSQSIIYIESPVAVNLIVQDMQGKLVQKIENAKQIDMSAYADGIYIFNITDKEGLILKKDKVVKRTN